MREGKQSYPSMGLAKRVQRRVSILELREALEASWRPDTANLFADEAGNPALGQCYPTARVVQHFFPSAEIVEGNVMTPSGIEKHFWNCMKTPEGLEMHIDFTWHQFPRGSSVGTWQIRDRKSLGDSEPTLQRVALLLRRVKKHLKMIQPG